MIKVFAFVPYPLKSTPSQRFRIEQWEPYLREDGISVEYSPFVDEQLLQILHQPGKTINKSARLLRAFGRSVGRLSTLRKYDAVVIHRAISIAGPAILERALKALNRPVVFDFDDAIYQLHTTSANRWFGWLKFPGKTASICRLSDHVTVGNAFLAEYAEKYNKNVTVVPTSIDIDQYRPPVPSKPNGKVVVGWTGSSTSQTHLEAFYPVLRPLLERRGVELRVISNRQPAIDQIECTWRPWTSATETQELGAIDIGIMPVPDDPWARGKCALKALQYMAMGIPTVCSPVGTNAEVIQHGVNGLLATRPQDWLTSLEALIGDANYRRELGLAGRRTVEERFSMRSSAGRFGRVVRSVVEAWERRQDSHSRA
jgi:glycosyltransferase involved in cell wall biosynthesis